MEMRLSVIVCLLLPIIASADEPDLLNVYIYRGRDDEPMYRFSDHDNYNEDWLRVTGSNAQPGDVSFFRAYEEAYPKRWPWSSSGGFTEEFRVCELGSVIQGVHSSMLTNHLCPMLWQDKFHFYVADSQRRGTTRLYYSTCGVPHGINDRGDRDSHYHHYYSRVSRSEEGLCQNGHALLNSGSFYAIEPILGCPPAPYPAHGRIINRQFQRGSILRRVQFQCDTGYSLEGDSSITCSSQGNWPSSLPSCSRISCGRPPTIANAEATEHQYYYGDYYAYSCHPGFELFPSYGRIQCQHHGWSDAGATCLRRTCGFPGHLENGDVIGNSYLYQDDVQFSCDRGYALRGPRGAICMENGQWNHQLPRCEAIRCPSLEAFVGGFRTYPNLMVGSEVVYQCSNGFTLQGSNVRRCLMDEISQTGSWSAPAPTCTQITCQEPTPSTHLTVHGSSFNYLDQVTYTCDVGYTLEGSERAICGHQGWDVEPPTCRAMRCPSPRIPLHVELSMVHSHDEEDIDGTYLYGDLITYTCETGFYAEGSSASQCGDGGRWSATPPQCLPIPCPSIGYPDHGSKDGDEYVFGSTVHFSCFPGYELDGNNTAVCLEFGVWSSPVPQCNTCPINTYKATGDNTECIPCPNNTFTTSTASTSAHHCICGTDSARSQSGECQVVECTPLEVPQHGQLEECSLHAGATCRFTCDAGYQLHGSATRRCTATGWTGMQTTCQACPADTYRSVTSGVTCMPCPRYTTTSGELGTSVQSCRCRAGYIMEQDGLCHDVDECSIENGGCHQTCTNTDGSHMCSCNIPGHELAADGVSCEVKQTCPALTEQPGNGFTLCQDHHDQNSVICHIRCNQGYFFVSGVNNYVTCGPNSEYRWSHQMVNATARTPACTREFFVDVQLPMKYRYDSDASCNALPSLYSSMEVMLNSAIHHLAICRKKCEVQQLNIQCRELLGDSQYTSEIALEFEVLLLNVEEEAVALECKTQCKRRNLRGMLTEAFNLKNAIEMLVQNSSSELSLSDLPNTNVKVDSYEFSRPQILCDEGRVLTPSRLCAPCDAGYYLPDRTQQTCLPCPVGTYQIQQGQTSCLPCPLGAKTLAEASDHPVMCTVRDHEYQVNMTTTTPGYYSTESSDVNEDEIDNILSVL